MHQDARMLRSQVGRWYHFMRLGLAPIWLAMTWLSGCAQPTVQLYNPQAQPPAQAPAVFDDREWATVLRDFDRDGLVDYQGLVKRPESLQKFIEQIGFVGPKRTPNFFPDDTARTAFYLNAYNACVLAAVLAAKVPPTMHDPRLPSLEYGYQFRVDGEIVVPANLRSYARAASNGNARVEFAMCDAALGSPPIYHQPFRPHNLESALNQLARAAMDDNRMVRVDHERQMLLVSAAIWQQRDVFIDMYRKETASRSGTLLNCLMHMASGQRRQFLSRAAGYDARILEFDRDLNKWTPPPAEE